MHLSPLSILKSFALEMLFLVFCYFVVILSFLPRRILQFPEKPRISHPPDALKLPTRVVILTVLPGCTTPAQEPPHPMFCSLPLLQRLQPVCNKYILTAITPCPQNGSPLFPHTRRFNHASRYVFRYPKDPQIMLGYQGIFTFH